MENSPYIYKAPQQEGIRGWLAFFLVVAAIGMAFTGVTSIIDFDIENYNIGGGHFTTFILSAIDVLFIMGIIGFGIFMIFSFVKLNSNAPVYGIIYCSLLLYSNCIYIIISLIAGEEAIAEGEEVQVVRGIIWNIIWILYIILSSQVSELFPKEKRRLPNPVLLITAIIVFLPLVSFMIGIFVAAGL